MNSGFSEGRADPYLFPARGRKPTSLSGVETTPRKVDPYLFPARGRKLNPKISGIAMSRTVDPYLFPARGRKLTVANVATCVTALC